MFIKTKERAGRTQFFLCIPERGGNDDGSWKTIEYSVCVGERLNLSSREWVDILRASPDFRSVPIEDVLQLFEKYVQDHKLSSDLLSGLREAARKPRRGFGNAPHSQKQSQNMLLLKNQNLQQSLEKSRGSRLKVLAAD